MLFQFLKNQSGMIQARGDYTNELFSITPNPSEVYNIEKLVVCFQHFDHGVEVYGGKNLISGTHIQKNGINTTPMPLKTLLDWRMLGASSTSQGNHMQIILLLEITLNYGDNFGLLLNDNFSHLNSHTFFVNGFIN